MERPISPFLSIYKPQVGSIFSILERISGILILVLLFTLVVSASFKNLFMFDYNFYSFIFVLYKGSLSMWSISSMLYFYIVIFFYHLMFSIRYLVWHWFGGNYKTLSLDLEGLYEISKIIFAATIVLSLIFWLFI